MVCVTGMKMKNLLIFCKLLLCGLGSSFAMDPGSKEILLNSLLTANPFRAAPSAAPSSSIEPARKCKAPVDWSEMTQLKGCAEEVRILWIPSEEINRLVWGPCAYLSLSLDAEGLKDHPGLEKAFESETWKDFLDQATHYVCQQQKITDPKNIDPVLELRDVSFLPNVTMAGLRGVSIDGFFPGVMWGDFRVPDLNCSKVFNRGVMWSRFFHESSKEMATVCFLGTGVPKIVFSGDPYKGYVCGGWGGLFLGGGRLLRRNVFVN